MIDSLHIQITDALHPICGADGNSNQSEPSRNSGRQGDSAPAKPIRQGPPVPPESAVLSEALSARIRHYVQQLQLQFPHELQNRQLAEQAVKCFAAVLMPRRRGRPPARYITEALRLKAQGVPRKRILELVIPGFRAMPPLEQGHWREKLRRGMYMRGKR